jgi:hypothetical protein
VIVTATGLLKELTAVARTLTAEPAAPFVSVSEVGVRVSEKFGTAAAETVTASLVAWLRAPEVPVRVTVALPAAAVELAISVNFCAVPGIN